MLSVWNLCHDVHSYYRATRFPLSPLFMLSIKYPHLPLFPACCFYITWCEIIRKNNATALSQQQYHFHSSNWSCFDSFWKGNTYSCVYPFVSFLCCTLACVPFHLRFTFRCHWQQNEKRQSVIFISWKIEVFVIFKIEGLKYLFTIRHKIHQCHNFPLLINSQFDLDVISLAFMRRVRSRLNYLYLYMQRGCEERTGKTLSVFLNIRTSIRSRA